METLLRNDFTKFYGLPISATTNILATTSATKFELKDDNTIIYTVEGQGIAKYSNPDTLEITVINYEYFFDSLSTSFPYGKKKCDLIVHDNKQQYIIFNELTNTRYEYVSSFENNKGQQPGKRQIAISQLLSSLTLMMNVPTIALYVKSHTFRHCCFFNKQSMSPRIINATTAFNRLSALVTGGLRMSNPDIESFDFEFWEYSGDQVYKL